MLIPEPGRRRPTREGSRVSTRPRLNALDLASRVQGLLHGGFKGDLAAASRALRVDEAELRRIVDRTTDSAPRSVLRALVHHFGVDPSWLITGEYDYRAHMRILQDEEEGPRGDSFRLIEQLAAHDNRDVVPPARPRWESLWGSDPPEPELGKRNPGAG